MKKICVLAMALMMLVVFNVVAFADEIPAGSASFDVKWSVEPQIYFGLAYADFSDYVLFNNGANLYGAPAFKDYIFADKTPATNIFDPGFDPYAEEEVYGMPLVGIVASNDWWKLEFVKPKLVSDNDQVSKVPVYAKRYFEDWDGTYSEKDWFTGNDLIKKDMGVYAVAWDLKVIYENWHTRCGNYENTFEIIVTQL